MKYILLFVIASSIKQSYAQFSPEEHKQIDTLTGVVNKYFDDSKKQIIFDSNINNFLNDLADIYWYEDFLKSRKYLEDALKFSKHSENNKIINYQYYVIAKLHDDHNKDSVLQLYEDVKLRAIKDNDTLLLLKTIHQIGWQYIGSSNHKLSFETFYDLKYRAEQIHSEQNIAKAYHGISNAYYYSGDREKYAQYSIKWLEHAEKSNDNEMMAKACSGVGYALFELEDWKGSKKYLEKSVYYSKIVDNKYVLAYDYTLLSSVYYKLANPEKAIGYSRMGIENSETDSELEESYKTISSIYLRMNKLDSAKHYLNLSYKKNKISKDLFNKVEIYYLNSDFFSSDSDLDSALFYVQEGLRVAITIKAMSRVVEGYERLITLYKSVSDKNNLFKYYNIVKPIKDSLEISKRKNELEYFYSNIELMKKEGEVEQLIINKKIQETDIKYQSKLTQFFAIVAVILLAGGLLVLKLFIDKRKSNKIIVSQKEKVEEQRDDIVASINYAKRIQNAILPALSVIKECLPESFILYKPKDVVAGDFYWMEQVGEITLFAAADCTGHGVPGAMVSVVCHNAMNRAVREFGLTDPGSILDRTREIVVLEFEKSDDDVKDGMDIALCSLEGYILKYAGAHNPLWIVREGVILETKANKQPIGKFDNPVLFDTHTIELQKGDSIYIFSDGYVDQFGGEKGKKYSSKRFKRTLIEIQNSSIKEQQEVLNTKFEEWKGSEEQIDDVCVMGVKI